jgi:hypothetical protein
LPESAHNIPRTLQWSGRDEFQAILRSRDGPLQRPGITAAREDPDGQNVLSRLVTMAAGSKLTDCAGQAAGDADDFIPIA